MANELAGLTPQEEEKMETEANRNSSSVPEIHAQQFPQEDGPSFPACSSESSGVEAVAVGKHASADEIKAARDLFRMAESAAALWPRPGPIQMEILGEDGPARACRVKLPHGVVETPLFMPVGTNGALKGIYPQLLQCIDTERQSGAPTKQPAQQSCGTVFTSLTQRHSPDGRLSTCEGVHIAKVEAGKNYVPSWFSGLILGNAFHLHRHVGADRMQEAEKGLHNFMGWQGNLLTDSGGFQMVSLSRLSDVHEEGVCFRTKDLGSPRKSRKRRAVLKGGQRISQAVRGETELHPGDEKAVETLPEDTSGEDSDDIILLTPEESIRIQVREPESLLTCMLNVFGCEFLSRPGVTLLAS